MISAVKHLFLGVNGNSIHSGSFVIVSPRKSNCNQEWELIKMDRNGWNINSNPEKVICSGVVYRIGNLMTLKSITEQRAVNQTVVALFHSHGL